MTDRTYTFTFGGGNLDFESSDGNLDEAQAATMLYLFATNIKPHAPLAALSDLNYIVQSKLIEQREEEA